MLIGHCVILGFVWNVCFSIDFGGRYDTGSVIQYQLVIKPKLNQLDPTGTFEWTSYSAMERESSEDGFWWFSSVGAEISEMMGF